MSSVFILPYYKVMYDWRLCNNTILISNENTYHVTSFWINDTEQVFKMEHFHGCVKLTYNLTDYFLSTDNTHTHSWYHREALMDVHYKGIF